MAEGGGLKVKQTCAAGLSRFISFASEYDTPKIVHVKSKKVGLVNRFVQLTVIAYIIGYVIVYKKGYQEFDDVESATTAKLKGVIYTNLTNISDSLNNIINHRIYDVADYVIPPQETDAFFVMTNMVLTPNQTQSICPEDINMSNVNCTVDDDCPKGEPVINGNGVRTGTCNHETKTCNIYAWCPVEKDVLPLPNESILKDSKRFTVLIKNQIDFIKFGVKRRNIIDIINDKNYLRNCTYSSTSEIDRFCPIFELQAIARYANVDYDEIAIKGGVIAININWDCNLDYSENKCRPEYSFRRLDNKDVNIAKGLNFRFANYYSDNNRNTRDLIKAYGIRFIIKVTGRAGKFNIVPLFLNIGSGIGLLGIATILCDFLMVHFLRKGYYYYDKKYFIVEDVDKELSSSFQEQLANNQPQPQAEEEHIRSRVGEYNRFRD